MYYEIMIANITTIYKLSIPKYPHDQILECMNTTSPTDCLQISNNFAKPMFMRACAKWFPPWDVHANPLYQHNSHLDPLAMKSQGMKNEQPVRLQTCQYRKNSTKNNAYNCTPLAWNKIIKHAFSFIVTKFWVAFSLLEWESIVHDTMILCRNLYVQRLTTMENSFRALPLERQEWGYPTSDCTASCMAVKSILSPISAPLKKGCLINIRIHRMQNAI